MILQRLKTTNDTNGNPRCVWIAYRHDGGVAAVRDEGYAGRPRDWDESDRKPVELAEIVVTPAEYRSWVARGHELEG